MFKHWVEVSPLKSFTLDEANALIPRLEKMLMQLQQLRDSLVVTGGELRPVLEHAGGNGGSKHASEYVVKMQAFNAMLDVFKHLGCELKDIDAGLVDFPAYRDGQLVYLCWKQGETEIKFWHPLDSGFANRQPLDG